MQFLKENLDILSIFGTISLVVGSFIFMVYFLRERVKILEVKIKEQEIADKAFALLIADIRVMQNSLDWMKQNINIAENIADSLREIITVIQHLKK